MIKFLAEALSQLRPNVGLIYNSGEPIDASKIIYDSESTQKITQTELDDKLNELSAEFENNQYQRDRAFEYPSIQDCIHALLDGGDTLTELQAKRSAIKAKYPKPS